MKLNYHPKHKDTLEKPIDNYEDAINIYQIKDLAERTFSTNTYAYYATGSCNMSTLLSNETDFERIKILPKVLVNCGDVDISTEVFGQKIDIPILFAPTALHKMAHFNGEIETAKASTELNTVLCLSSISSLGLSAVSPYAKHKWMQLYVLKDMTRTEKFIQMVEKNGYTVLVVTVDTPVMGIRDVENISQFTDERISTSDDTSIEAKIKPKKHVESGMGNFFNQTYNNTLDWSLIPWLKERTKMKIVLKGIHRPDDAILAAKAGVDGIIISNHGGRQLDSAPSGIMMLKPIVDALKKEGLYEKMEVYVDGGIRRGVDVFKAIALGAKAVLVGRPILWGLSVGGKEGIKKVYSFLRREFANCMALSGCKRVKDITEDYVYFDSQRQAKF